MPIKTQIHAETKMVYVYGWGVFLPEDVLAHRKSLMDDSTYQPGFALLVDFRDVVEIDIPHANLQALARGAKNPFYNAESKMAIVAKAQINFGVSRIYQAYCDVLQIGVFYKMENATEWLKVSLENANKILDELHHAA